MNCVIERTRLVGHAQMCKVRFLRLAPEYTSVPKVHKSIDQMLPQKHLAKG